MAADLIFLSSHLDRILKKLASSSLQEFGVVRGLETDVKNLESTLGTIQTVIVDAEAAQQLRSEDPSSWVLELKDLAYDAEDVVYELLIEAANRERHSRGRLGYQVRAFFSSRNPLIFRSKMRHKLKDVRKSLDKIARERSFDSKEGSVESEFHAVDGSSSHGNE
ncbi:hypothetical protein Vadar_021197 [Vaccinium darrowii]|uniref:Uncharacterized protein n=1 Tax=Vaccinium darrowii TaxID=229202 RepID=A0ACB7Y113_9ERIC|nr:hypothetical protein Vadar_021197 [Vaccinium darrowii]